MSFSARGWAQENDQNPGVEPEPAAQEAARQRQVAVTGLGEWALAQQYPEQALWLDLEDDSRALGLFSPELETPARGAMIVLADEGQTADQSVVGALREALSESGVAALTLGLQAPPRVLRNSRLARNAPTPGEQEEGETDASSPPGAERESVMIDVAAEEDMEQLAEDYREGVRAVLDAAATELNEHGYEQLLVTGIGWSADYVIEWAIGRQQLTGAVWLAPKFSPRRLSALTELLAADRNWWLMDIHHSGGEAEKRGRERGAALARAGVARYQRQAVPLFLPPRSEDAGRVVGRIKARLGK